MTPAGFPELHKLDGKDKAVLEKLMELVDGKEKEVLWNAICEQTRQENAHEIIIQLA